MGRQQEINLMWSFEVVVQMVIGGRERETTREVEDGGEKYGTGRREGGREERKEKEKERWMDGWDGKIAYPIDRERWEK